MADFDLDSFLTHMLDSMVDGVIDNLYRDETLEQRHVLTADMYSGIAKACETKAALMLELSKGGES